MSQRKAFASRCIKNLLVFCDFPKNIRVSNCAILNQIDGSEKQFAKCLSKAEIVLHPLPNRRRLQFHQKVSIAALGWIEVGAQNRPKGCKPPHTIRTAQAGNLIKIAFDRVFHDAHPRRISPH